MAEVWGAPGTRPSDHAKAERKQAKAREAQAAKEAKPSKKHTKKGRSLRDMAYETMSASNVITRDDMARGAHKDPRAQVDEQGRFRYQVPMPAGEVLDAAFGSLSTTDEAPLALQVINEHGAGLKLGMREWAIVQHLVEAGIRMGYQWSESARG